MSDSIPDTGAFLYVGSEEQAREWARIFAERAPELDFRAWPDIGEPAAIRYIAFWRPLEDAATRFPNLVLVFSLGAGADQIDLRDLPERITLLRLVDPNITAQMVEYVSFAVLALHRDTVRYTAQQREGVWQPLPVSLAAERRVGILGLGVLGSAAASRLRDLGFRCAGWSRSVKRIPGVECHAGNGALASFLAKTDILVCMLPLTGNTRGLLSAELLAQLPRGAALVNVGRGAHVVVSDLIAALDAGHLSAAIVDVVDGEPPAPDHPFWTHPRILMTPHVASVTRPGSAIASVLDNLARHGSGRPLLGAVDRSHGY